jgi:tetratricopeptide (TPR) repeat protein
MPRVILQSALLALLLEAWPFASLATNAQHPSLPVDGFLAPSSLAASSSRQPPAAAAPDLASDLLAESNHLYRKGEFDTAIQKYNAILQANPKTPEAYAGLARVYLKQKHVEQAYDTISKGLLLADSAPVRVALGEVYFRQGKILEAGREWEKVIDEGHSDARAYWGLARVYRAASLYRRAKTAIDKAHEMDPDDPDIQKHWIGTLRVAEQIQYWESYLASPTNDDPETRAGIQRRLNYLKARQNQPHHSCRMVSHVTSTETRLVRLLTDPTHLRGYGVAVSLNDKKAQLMLDTGASGIVIDQNVARKAGITELSEASISGIGDKGPTGGFYGLAGSIKIGDLEFQDCTVTVSEKRSVLGEDGLIGGDVFSAFLVDVDFPHEKLRLKELPKRPDESSSEVALQTGERGAEPSGDQRSEKAGAEVGTTSPKPAYRGPHDRYIAPEMQSYTQVFRFGHQLLVPTTVGNAPPSLFLLDTGSSINNISLNAAQEVTKVHGDPHAQVRGLSGSVANVYRANTATIQFGHLRQENQDIITLDLSHMSDWAGTEISGTLGFPTLRILEIQIDYRDGLVDFSYKARP